MNDRKACMHVLMNRRFMTRGCVGQSTPSARANGDVTADARDARLGDGRRARGGHGRRRLSRAIGIDGNERERGGALFGR